MAIKKLKLWKIENSEFIIDQIIGSSTNGKAVAG